MKVAWLQDLNFITEAGGAQLTDRTHFSEGIRRGHDMILCTPEGGNPIPRDHDIYIISNISLWSVDLFHEMLTWGKPLVWFNHDYFPICKYRLFYPMRETCKSCYLKERWLPIFMKSHLMIWLSPLHRESWMWLYPELREIPYHLAPSPVQSDNFKDLGLPRDGVVAVESLFPFKGREHVLHWAEQHQQIKVTFVGGNPQPQDPLPPNCISIGPVSPDGMNEVYNQHEALLHLPQSPSPFDRVVAEAYLAGCKIIGNDNVGALSWDEAFKQGRKAVATLCRESPKLFWKAIKDSM